MGDAAVARSLGERGVVVLLLLLALFWGVGAGEVMSPLFVGRRRRERMAWRGGRKSKVWGGGRGG